MLPELDRLVRLQRLLDTATAEAQEAIEAIPAERDALDARNRSARVPPTWMPPGAGSPTTGAARQEAENDLAQVQARLTRYKDPAHGGQDQQGVSRHAGRDSRTAEGDVARLEDQVLEQMLQADELTTAVADAEGGPGRGADRGSRRSGRPSRHASGSSRRRSSATRGERAALVGELAAPVAAPVRHPHPRAQGTRRRGGPATAAA